MSYVDDLEKAVADARTQLEAEFLPQLRSEYALQASAVGGLLGLMVNKRLIHSDPYTYDSKMAEIELPDISSFPDNEKASVIGSRLSHYQRMLEFVANYYQFTCDYLNQKRIVLLEKLMNVFPWDDFSITGSSPNTAAMASIIDTAVSSTDNMTASILRNTVDQLGKSSVATKNILNKLSLVHKEAYKVFLRKTVVPLVPANLLAMDADINDMCVSVKKTFASHFHKTPFFQDLVFEVLTEDFSAQGATAKEDCLKKLNFKPTEAKKAETQVDYRQLLLSGLKTLASSGEQLGIALDKILFNEELINKETTTFFTKLKALFRKAFNIKEPDKEITVVIEDPITHARKKEVINLNSFKEAVERKMSIFKNLNANPKALVLKLDRISEQVLFDNFSQYISDCNDLMNKMAGLDQYYKTVKPSVRAKIKGIKVEITTIRNYILNANQYKAEYAGRMDEQAQMKKLGITGK